jgi:hypothetical protein
MCVEGCEDVFDEEIVISSMLVAPCGLLACSVLVLMTCGLLLCNDAGAELVPLSWLLVAAGKMSVPLIGCDEPREGV